MSNYTDKIRHAKVAKHDFTTAFYQTDLIIGQATAKLVHQGDSTAVVTLQKPVFVTRDDSPARTSEGGENREEVFGTQTQTIMSDDQNKSRSREKQN